MGVERLKVSFIDKDTMCAVRADSVEVYTSFTAKNKEFITDLAAYYFDEEGTEKEVEIKIINK